VPPEMEHEILCPSRTSLSALSRSMPILD
jgi:hypothetical protein